MGRPRTAVISRERAAKAALSVIDVRGVGGFSLEAVATRLGVKAPSLYHHFSDKNALLAEVARLLLLNIVIPKRAPKEDPQEWFVQCAVAVRRSILEHPNAAPLLFEFFPRHLLLSAYEKSLGHLNLPVELHMATMEGLDILTYGSALFAASARAQRVEMMPPIEPEQYPNLSQAVRHNPHDEDAQFATMVRAFLQGLSALSNKPGRSEVRKSPRRKARAD
jgi:TetR/AcrR family transcriptional regulator, tetracycline repressor protein